MRFKGSFAKGLIAAVVLTLVPLVAFSAQKITPGSTCKVLNQKVVYNSKSYTCIKSGKKLVWNKGVMVANPSPTATPTVSKFVTPTIPKSFQELESNLSGIIYGAWLKGSNQIASG